MLSWSSINNLFLVIMATTKMSILVVFNYVYRLLSNNMQNSEKIDHCEYLKACLYLSVHVFAKNSKYDQEIPQSQTTPLHREEEPLNLHETP